MSVVEVARWYVYMCYRRGSWCHVRNNVPFFGWQKLISTSIKSLKVEIFLHGMHIFCFLLFCFRYLFEITSVLYRTFLSSFNVVRNPKSRFRNQTGLVIFFVSCFEISLCTDSRRTLKGKLQNYFTSLKSMCVPWRTISRWRNHGLLQKLLWI